MEQLKRLIKEFKSLQENLSDFGAADTEPDEEFQFMISNAIRGKIIVPDGPSDWQLFQRLDGATKAAEQMTKLGYQVAKEVKKCIFESDNPSDIINELKEICWRINL